MLLGASHRLHDQNQVQGLREGGILGARTGHVDDAFLEADDLTGGNTSRTLQDVGLAGTDSVDLGDDAGEHAAGALNLNTGLDDVLNGGDTDGLTGFCDVEFNGLDVGLYVVVVLDESLHVVSVDVQNAVLDSTFV